MPVLKHAKKKLRQDKKRTADNLKIKKAYKKLLKVAKLEKTTEAISAAYQAIDKAAKKIYFMIIRQQGLNHLLQKWQAVRYQES